MTALHWATCANALTLSLFYWHSVYIDELLSTVYMCACVCLYVYVWYIWCVRVYYIGPTQHNAAISATCVRARFGG